MKKLFFLFCLTAILNSNVKSSVTISNQTDEEKLQITLQPIGYFPEIKYQMSKDSEINFKNDLSKLTKISWKVAINTSLPIEIFDTNGKEIYELENEKTYVLTKKQVMIIRPQGCYNPNGQNFMHYIFTEKEEE